MTTYDKQSLAFALPPDPEEEITRDDYRELLNTYNSPSDLWDEPMHQLSPEQRRRPDTRPAREHAPLAPRLVITPKQEEGSSQQSARKPLTPVNEGHAARLRGFERKVRNGKLGERTNEIWWYYDNMAPRSPLYLSDATIHRLFQHLAWVEFKDLGSSKRYLDFLEEALSAGIEPTAAEWNTAIAFAGRWARLVTSEQVKSAVQTWMRMENTGMGVKPTHVTFNILFDIASRAGRFALADTIISELKARDMPLNRYYRTSMIHYAGLRRDGRAVRAAFRELVNAGEIVDTAVMNCVILALVRAGELPSAESVFLKMKTLHADKFEAITRRRDWIQERKLGRKLDKAAQRLREEKLAHESSFFGSKYSNEEHKEAAQRQAPIHPNARTCRILLKHHCLVTGDLERVRELMAEMQTEICGGSVHGSVYTELFTGFWRWGGHAYTAWNRRSLQQYWDEFLEAVERGRPHSRPHSAHDRSARSPAPADIEDSSTTDDSSATYSPFASSAGTPRHHGDSPKPDQEDMSDPSREESPRPGYEEMPKPDREETPFEDRPAHFSPFLCRRAVYAFYKCAGAKKVMAVWQEIQKHWPDMSEDERLKVEEHVQKAVRDDYAPR